MRLLESISVDICGPLPISLSGMRYFMEIVDQRSRRAWVYPTRDRKDAVRLFQHWKQEAELEADDKVQGIRIDNAPELVATVKDWGKSFGVREKPTVPYTSHQNGIAERGI